VKVYRSIATLASVLLVSSVRLGAPALQARQKAPVVAFASDTLGERVSTGILFFDQEKQRSVGNVAISYGQPVWKDEYEDATKFDSMTKGQVWRLGKDFWTTLDTNLPFKVGGKEIPAGYWYLGLHRSADGATWSLALLDPAKARKTYAIPAGLPLGHGPAPDLLAPLTAAEASSVVEKLKILVTREEEDLRRATLRIAWGKLLLTAPIELEPAR